MMSQEQKNENPLEDLQEREEQYRALLYETLGLLEMARNHFAYYPSEWMGYYEQVKYKAKTLLQEDI